MIFYEVVSHCKLFAHKFELSMKGLLLNDQKVTTETKGIGLDSVMVSVKDDVVIPANSQKQILFH